MYQAFLKLLFRQTLRIQLFLDFKLFLLRLFPPGIFLFQFRKQRIRIIHADIREPRSKSLFNFLRKRLSICLRLLESFFCDIHVTGKVRTIYGRITDFVLQRICIVFFLQIRCFQLLQFLQNSSGGIKRYRRFPRCEFCIQIFQCSFFRSRFIILLLNVFAKGIFDVLALCGQAIQTALSLFHFAIDFTQFIRKIIEAFRAAFNSFSLLAREMFLRTANWARFAGFQVMAQFRNNDRNIFLNNRFLFALQRCELRIRFFGIRIHFTHLRFFRIYFVLQTQNFFMVAFSIRCKAVCFRQNVDEFRISFMRFEILLQHLQFLFLAFACIVKFLQRRFQLFEFF